MTTAVVAAAVDTDAAATSSTTDNPDGTKSPPRMITPEELARYVTTFNVAKRASLIRFYEILLC